MSEESIVRHMNKDPHFFVAQLGNHNTVLRTSAVPGAKPMATKWAREIIRTHYPEITGPKMGGWGKSSKDGWRREIEDIGILSLDPLPLYAMWPDGKVFRIQSIFF